MTFEQQFIAFRTIVLKEMMRFLRIWVQTVLPAAITMGLYFVIFGNLIGSQLAPIHGFNYVDYIVPGIILMAIINNSYANVVSSFFSAKFQRHIEEMLVSPMPNYLILLGFVGGGLMRGLVVGVSVTLVATFFTDLKFENPGIVILVVVLTSILFALGGFINAIYAKTFDDISIIPTFVLTPLTYLGGIFYSVEMLPGIWQSISYINPILYMINAMRYGMLGVSDINVATALLIIIAFVVGLFVYSMYLLKKGVGIRN